MQLFAGKTCIEKGGENAFSSVNDGSVDDEAYREFYLCSIPFRSVKMFNKTYEINIFKMCRFFCFVLQIFQ